MRKLAAIICLSALTIGAFAQGTVTFANGPTTLISYNPTFRDAAVAIPASPVGSYYFALLISPSASGPFGGTGVSGFTIATILEPAGMAMAGLGAACLLIFRRRK